MLDLLGDPLNVGGWSWGVGFLSLLLLLLLLHLFTCPGTSASSSSSASLFGPFSALLLVFTLLLLLELGLLSAPLLYRAKLFGLLLVIFPP